MVEISQGHPSPLGATVMTGGVNFSLFSANATSVELLLFDRMDQPDPVVIALDPQVNHTYYYWHVMVHGIGHGQIYGYRVHGPYCPERGMRFNAHKILLDPYTRLVAYGDNWDRRLAYGMGDNTVSALKSVVVDDGLYDWEGDEPHCRPMGESIFYEMHVRGFTRHDSSGVAHPGTYRGVIEKIPYLQNLGITAIELLPVQQHDEQEVERENPITGEPLINYWGYAPLAPFAPHAGYAVKGGLAALDEFRDMVKALHRAGIEVIVDVVFNHTAEGDEKGPTICLRGLENVAYYMLKEDPRYYYDFSGCGNTVSGNHSIVRRLIRNCLRYWVRELHVDGFRFDLASILSRDEDGTPIDNSPILWELESDPVLAGTKLIAEAWDAGGLYQLGSFTGDRWAEWNGRFRDDVRRFVRGEAGMVRDLAWRMTGSYDLFRDKDSFSWHRSVNYITCHDGFTLNDLVSYQKKHNEANGENNLDGWEHNLSWNCGAEGETDDPEILSLRFRQMHNLMALLLLGRGTPLVLGGDEFGRTQQGNNNAYCQDNEISWFDWGLLQENDKLYHFVRYLIWLRRQHPTLRAYDMPHPGAYREGMTQGVSFHGTKLHEPDWTNESRSLAIQFHGVEGDIDFCLLINAFWGPLEFELSPEKNWRCLFDTWQMQTETNLPVGRGPLNEGSYTVEARSVVLLAEWQPGQELIDWTNPNGRAPHL